jgi:hypothetical protein
MAVYIHKWDSLCMFTQINGDVHKLVILSHKFNHVEMQNLTQTWQFGVKFHTCNIVAWKMSNMKLTIYGFISSIIINTVQYEESR